MPKQKGMAMVISRRPLKNIVKITSKKKMPEFITFKYGTNVEDGMVVTDTERFIIEKAGKNSLLQVMHGLLHCYTLPLSRAKFIIASNLQYLLHLVL